MKHLNASENWDVPSVGPLPDRVVIINDLSQTRGGATAIALLSARLLADRGIPVTLITGDSAPFSFDADERPFEVASVNSTHILSGVRVAAFARGLYNHQAAQFLGQWIALNDNPRVVYHLHG